ncbi:MAG: acyl-CoA dehydrogenase family protein [Chloroflexota bacterium]
MSLGALAFGGGAAVEHDTAPLRAEVRQFLAGQQAAGRFQPHCDAWLSGHDPEFSRELGRRGWIGLNWPSRYGGRDRPEIERYAITEELLAAGAPVSAHWIAQRQSGPLLLRFGTEQQRERFLPAIANGECYFAICMSEPDAGSDLAAATTRATRVDGGWSVTGRKVWTSHAHRSHYAILFCRTAPPSENRHAGFSQFILDLNAPGVTVRPIRLLTGEAHFNEVTFDEVFIPDELVVGEVGNGWLQVTSELGYERSGPERFMSPLPLLLAWLGSLTPSPEPADAELLGRLAARLWSLRQLSLAVTAGLQRGDDVATQAALVKDLGTAFEQASIEAIRAAVGREPDPSSRDTVEMLLAQAIASAPGFTLRGGTNEILRGIVARALGVR